MALAKFRKNTIILALLFAVAFLLISLDLKKEETPFPSLNAILAKGLLPAQKAISTFGGSVFGLGSFLRETFTLRKENTRLREEVEQLNQEKIILQRKLLANQRLGPLLKLKERLPLATTGARIVARDPSGWFKAVWLDKGTREGLRKDLAVISSQGLVGRIVEVFEHSAKVLLIIDPNSALDALTMISREQGIVYGWSKRGLILRYLPRTAKVDIGDLVVSSGLAAIYPKGLVLGRITKLRHRRTGLFLEAEVSPEVNFSKLEEVLVTLPGNKRGERL